MKFRLRIKEIRKAHGMKQKELARKLCYHPRTVSAWERGISLPTIDTLAMIAELFGCALDDLVEKKEGKA